MDPQDLEIRNRTYRHIVETGRAPTPGQVAAAAGTTDAGVVAAWRRLHEAHALVLDDHDAIRMLNPFSAVSTPFRVTADGRSWFANCGWDAFGIGAALHADSVIDTACADCQEPLRIVVTAGRPEPDDLLWHVLVPARAWWADIGAT
jgi:hypothetical protein